MPAAAGDVLRTNPSPQNGNAPCLRRFLLLNNGTQQRSLRMTRAKETPPGSGLMPEYKSHPTRIYHSTRKAYDNLRVRLQDKSKKINSLRGKQRDLEKSRQQWRKEA